MKNIIAASMLAAAAAGSAVAADLPADIDLPKPVTTGGMPLMDALSARKTIRSFDSKELSAQELSNILWAACGLNREDGRRTSPTACNSQEIDVYVALPSGVYFYDAKANKLVAKVAGDLRADTGMQPFVGKAPVNLVFVSETSRMEMGDDGKAFYSSTDAAFASQNVYLYCASEGLATVVRGAIDRDAIAKKFGLPATCRVVLAQSVGYSGK